MHPEPPLLWGSPVPPSLGPVDYGKSRYVVEAGQIISGKYKILRLLGDGGMGSVHEAEHLGLGTHVAIKMLHTDLARRAGIAERFLQEARVSAQIKSPHVVQVTDVDRTPEGAAYLVMELLQGEPLSSLVKREQKLAVPIACEYTSQILQALEAAHSLGVIHRDLKPDNVFVTFQGGKPVLKLIDFGIAKLKASADGKTKNLTVAGMLMGTPEYMAPEQAYSAAEVDVRADLYAVGVMLYEMLSGKPPATADDPRVLILKIERGEVTPLVQAAPGIQPELAGFVHRAMAPRPELRFANATEMRITLEGIVSGKRAGTAKINAHAPNPLPNMSQAPAVPVFMSVAVNPPKTNQFSQVPVHSQQAPKTNTVMGAPVDAALQAVPNTGPPPPNNGGGTGTAAAPPIQLGGGGYGPPMQQMPMAPNPYEAANIPQQPTNAGGGEKRGGGSGLIIALAVVALLLGAGAVVAYIAGTQGPKVVQPEPLPTMPTNTVTTPTTVTTPVNTNTVPTGPVTPLTNTTPTTPPTRPNVPTAKDAGVAHQDAGPTPAADAGAGQTTIVTPFGTFQFPGPRPLLWPPDQPWPPPTIQSPMPPP